MKERFPAAYPQKVEGEKQSRRLVSRNTVEVPKHIPGVNTVRALSA